MTDFMEKRSLQATAVTVAERDLRKTHIPAVLIPVVVDWRATGVLRHPCEA
jgi:hypothetical protein